MQLTPELLAQNLPAKLKKNVTPDLCKLIEDIVEDDLVREDFKENLLSYTNVLTEGDFNIGQYLDAVHYVTHRMMGSGILQSYSKTFPDRYNKLVARGATQKDISSFSTAYNKNKLVNLIVEQTMIPTHILNVETHQKAINKLADIMNDDDVSARVQVDAATGLLTHLATPQTNKVQVDITVKDESINELKKTTRELAAKQLEMLEQGLVTAPEVAQSTIVKTIPAT